MRSLLTLLGCTMRWFAIASIMVACLTLAVGCGGESDTPDAAPVDSEGGEQEAGKDDAESGPEAEPSEEPEPEPKPADQAKKPAAEPAASSAAEPVAQKKPRPDDVAVWQNDDFRAAKQDRDPRLLDAVAFLGEHYSGDASAAQLLVELLATPEDPEPEPKPEPKVEKKPEKKPSSGYGEEGDDMYGEGYMGEGDEGDGMYGEGYMGEGDEEDGMYGEGYMGEEGDDEEYMEEGYGEYGEEEYGDGYGGGSGSRRKPQTKAPLAASYVSLTGGIVRALGANGTKQSRQVLEQLLAGKMPSGNDRAAVGAVLRTLVDYPSDANDTLILQTLTAPESYRPSGEKLAETLKTTLTAVAPAAEEGEAGPDVDSMVAAALANTVTAEDLRDTTLPLVEQSASMGLRVKLAKYLIGAPSKEIGPRLQELVTVSHPLNIQAQVGLYRYTKTPVEMKDSFERYFTTYASSALGRMLSVSTDTGANVEIPLDVGGGGAGAAEKPGWTGFGDKPTEQPKQPGSGYGYGEGYGEEYEDEGYMGEREMPGEDYREGYGPGPGPGPGEGYGPGQGYEEGYEEGYGPGPGQGFGEQSEFKPPRGPGAADKLSMQKFEEVAAGNPNLPYELAKQFWGASLGQAMAAKMNALTSLDEGAQVIMLAGAIPTDAMRAQLFKTLQAHWTDGPAALASASAYAETGISDPGFVAVVKSLPRRMPPVEARTAPTAEQEAQYAWMATAYGTVRGLCDRFRTASENEMVNTAEVIESLPFKLHSTDNVSHIYAVDWQQRVGERLTGATIDPMRIYYAKMEETAQFTKVQGAYKRSVPSGSERWVKEGLWIESLRANPGTGRKTSLDVIIERPEYNAERPLTEAEPLIVQVLYVEINDPAPAPAEEK